MVWLEKTDRFFQWKNNHKYLIFNESWLFEVTSMCERLCDKVYLMRPMRQSLLKIYI